MLSSNKIKVIKSLDKKKFRQKYNLFAVEGTKNIKEFVFSGYFYKNIFAVEPLTFLKERDYELISYAELKKISFLKNPNNALALFEIPSAKILPVNGIQLVLDDIQDPGNLGTIIRLADWFGIEQILCSEGTADVYNPKVVQATMGSLSRINIFYVNLPVFLQKMTLPVFAADMEGENLFKAEIPQELLLVMGNEGNGISEEVKKLSHKVLSIPRFGKKQKTESLNVAVSAAVILGEIFSKKLKNEK
ncbi:MAG: RNA methyltransferase [Flavobacteriaceae bacterium]|jgi:TrmH family RNA methyltransferase|nr:RNA methyltransferase [Flavobacteriaceae bacterium]